MSKKIDTLLNRIDDPALRAALAEEFAEATADGKVGLVFEHHLPETVTLRNVRPRRGLRVRLRSDGDDAPLMTVLRVSRGQATCAHARTGEGDHAAQGGVLSVPVDDLVVVAEFGEPIYPGLREVARVAGPGADPSAPQHVVLNAENHHALQALQWSHEGAVDVIYIDPPYNLGGDLTYNDRRIGKEDQYRHSFWLSFMERRLELARKLLKPTGVIIVAIDDTEQAHLKLLMDQVFHENNFVANVIWQGGRKNDSRYVSVGHDYMLIYARDEGALRASDTKWRERKPGIDRVRAAAREIWDEVVPDKIEARKRMKKWYSSLDRSDPARALSRYSFFNVDGSLARDSDITWPGGGGPRYEVVHPATGAPVAVPRDGWRFGSPERMREAIDNDEVIFGEDETTPISLKKHLNATEGSVAMSVFERQRTHATRSLSEALGEKRFTFPKDTEVLARWINLVTQSNPDAVVLDFFAGSGSTAQAVMELNGADGGHRQSILVTNNEVDEKTAKRLAKDGHAPGEDEYERWGIFRRVTKPRVETIVTGVREDGSRYSDGLPETVAFYELTYLDPERVKIDAAFTSVAPLLWLRAGGVGPVIADRSTHGFSVTERYGVLHDVDDWQAFAEALPDSATTAFIVTDSPSSFATAADALPSHVTKVRLYEKYIRTFEINTGERAPR